jgi:hypothetical protein
MANWARATLEVMEVRVPMSPVVEVVQLEEERLQPQVLVDLVDQENPRL